jgi:hypothetical protein
MAVVVTQSGSQTCTVSTEHTVTSTITAAGTYVFKVDLNAAANGDIFEFRTKSKVRAADTQRNVDYWTVANVQSDFPVFESIPIAIAVSENLDCSMKQTAGTGRAVPWEVMQIDA